MNLELAAESLALSMRGRKLFRVSFCEKRAGRNSKSNWLNCRRTMPLCTQQSLKPRRYIDVCALRDC